jgi:hypothetical protein
MGILSNIASSAGSTLVNGLLENLILNPLVINPLERRRARGALESLEQQFPQFIETQANNNQVALNAALSGNPIDTTQLANFNFSDINPDLLGIEGGSDLLFDLAKKFVVGGVDLGDVGTKRAIEKDKAVAGASQTLGDIGIFDPLESLQRGERPAFPTNERFLEATKSTSLAGNAGNIRSKEIEKEIAEIKDATNRLGFEVDKENIRASVENSKRYLAGLQAQANAKVKAAEISAGAIDRQTAASRSKNKKEVDAMNKEAKKIFGKATPKDFIKQMTLTNPEMFETTRTSTGETKILTKPKPEFRKFVNNSVRRMVKTHSQVVSGKIEGPATLGSLIEESIQQESATTGPVPAQPESVVAPAPAERPAQTVTRTEVTPEEPVDVRKALGISGPDVDGMAKALSGDQEMLNDRDIIQRIVISQGVSEAVARQVVNRARAMSGGR